MIRSSADAVGAGHRRAGQRRRQRGPGPSRAGGHVGDVEGVARRGQGTQDVVRTGLVGRELVQHLLDANRVEHRLRFAHADAGLRGAQQHASAVLRIALAADVSLPLQPIDRERHRRQRDAHVLGEGRGGDRIDLVEVIENAGLVRAEEGAARGIAHVARVAGEEDARVGVHQLSDVQVARGAAPASPGLRHRGPAVSHN